MSRNIRTNILYLADILELLSKGQLQVLNFQRFFAWKPESMISLFDSIYLGYPIGSLLFWKTNNKCNILSKIGPHPANTNNIAKTYMVDGLQRISTLFGTLIGDVKEEEPDYWKWRIYFDLSVNDKAATIDTKRFYHLKPNTEPLPHYFPLNKLLKTTDFLIQAKRLNQYFGEKAELYIERAETLLAAVRDYTIPITEIQSDDTEEVINIFTRINSEESNRIYKML